MPSSLATRLLVQATHEVMPRHGDEHEGDGPAALTCPVFDAQVPYEHDLAHIETGHAEREQ